jgi:hypothetical protein
LSGNIRLALKQGDQIYDFLPIGLLLKVYWATF